MYINVDLITQGILFPVYAHLTCNIIRLRPKMKQGQSDSTATYYYCCTAADVLHCIVSQAIATTSYPSLRLNVEFEGGKDNL